MIQPGQPYRNGINQEVDHGISGGKPQYPNILLLSGTGRNCGKTTAACHLIRKLGSAGKVTAIKISPHFHEWDDPETLFEQSGDYAIFIENSSEKPKDSSRMLKAGADKVYYVQARKEFLSEAWSVLCVYLDPVIPTIVEAGGLNRLISPGISLLLRSSNPDHRKHEIMNEDFDVVTSLGELDSTTEKINFRNGRWRIDEGHDGI